MLVIGTALGLLIGLALGMLGGGGSILTVPAFVYVLGFEAKPAIAMSLAVVGVTALVGAVGHWRVGNVHLRVALVFGGVAMAGAYLGAKLSVFFSGSTQLTLFAAVMIAAAYFMLRGRVPGVSVEQTGIHLRRGDRIPIALIVLAGIAVGILTGLVGVGGGFLIVPA
ncbi:MAG TPA: sulfite exporter TauE/SafE family protein, partial [Gemmatimonadota bacterium]|nr:sulfite exporter TauE/SafE family protein [Gemmatimonadota bacterium]